MNEQERIRQAQREYHRQWRKANPDKVRERNRRYWLKRAEQLEEQAKRNEVDSNDTSKQ